MGGGSQDTSSKTVSKPPKWFNDAAIKSLEIADKINQAGYVPYMGNQVAAFTPMQQQAMQGVSDWASAANGTGKVDAMAGIPQAKVDGSGVAGYESATGMMRNLETMKKRFPRQYDQIAQFGGDLLADPSRPPSDIPDSPWSVGETAKQAAAASAMGGDFGAFGRDPYTFEQLMQQGAKGGTIGTLAAFLGTPYYSRRNGGQTSAYQQLYNNDVLWGRNPWGSQQPLTPPKEDRPPPNYNSPDKWW